MANRFMTQDEVLDVICKPMLVAFKAAVEEARADAKKAFAEGTKKVWREHIMGVAIEFTPENVDAI